MICDFCSVPNPRWNCPARTAKVPGEKAVSVGAWLACDICCQLIAQMDRAALAGRGLLTPIAKELLLIAERRDVLRSIEIVQNVYWNNAAGAPTLLP